MSKCKIRNIFQIERSDGDFLTDGEGVEKNGLRMSLNELRMS